MIIDGRAIAAEMLVEVKERVVESAAQAQPAPRLTIITCTPNFETQKYLALKKRKASEAGIATNVIELLDDCTTDGVVKTITVVAEQSTGIVVQLPLPEHIDTDKVLASIPASHDVDGVHYDGENGVLPPVVGAIAEIAAQQSVSVADKQVVIIGAGRLVGTPALLWATNHGAQITLVTKETSEAERLEALATADVIISGAGAPALVQPEHIKDGVVLFDAGTSEDGGTLVGDIDPACAEKSALYTPVPGGIGPVTVACLLRNAVALVSQ